MTSKQHNNINWAVVIMIASVLASVTRWTMALLDSEGIAIGADWMTWWKIAALIADVGMAVVEGAGFMYAFSAWKHMKNEKHQKIMVWLIVFSALSFIVVMTPAIVSHSQGKQVSDVLSGLFLWVWGIGVVTSTISVLSMVGYADGRMQEMPKQVVVKEDSVIPVIPKPESKEPAKTKPFNSYKEFEAHVLSLNGTGTHIGIDIAKKLIADGQPVSTSYTWVNLLSERHPEYSPAKVK